MDWRGADVEAMRTPCEPGVRSAVEPSENSMACAYGIRLPTRVPGRKWRQVIIIARIKVKTQSPSLLRMDKNHRMAVEPLKDRKYSTSQDRSRSTSSCGSNQNGRQVSVS